MLRLYQKNELAFSLIWLFIYVSVSGAADCVPGGAEAQWAVKALLYAGLAVTMAAWIAKNGLWGKYGLARVKVRGRQYLYFLPLAAITSAGLWSGAAVRYSVPAVIVYAAAMLCVAFIEEVLFRGFLFQALEGWGAMGAAVASSLIFGGLHILNLLGGATAPDVLLQAGYAAALGFLFAVLFYRTKSLAPCVAAHGVINVLSAFGKEMGVAVTAAVICASLVYAAWIWKSVPQGEKH